MKFQRRILPPHSPTYLEMEEYTAPSSSSRQSISATGSTSDLSEVGSVYSLSTTPRQRSDSLNNLFNMSEDSASVSNLSLASYSLSQYSCDTGSYTNTTVYTSVSPVTIPSSPVPPVQYATSTSNGSERISRKQHNSSYRSLTEEQSSPINNRKSNSNNTSRRSGDSARHYHFGSSNASNNSLTTSSQRSFPSKTAESVLNTIGINKSSSNGDLTDKCGLIAHDANDIENNDDDNNNNHTNDNPNLNQPYQHADMTHFNDSHYVDSSDENELDMTLSRNSSGTGQTGRGFRKTVLSNVDRLLNSGSKQIKL